MTAFPDINPKMLKFARESMAYDIEIAAKKLGYTDLKKQSAAEKLLAVESGKAPISYTALESAANHYKRSLTFFYLNSIPEDNTKEPDFRTFNSEYSERSEAWLKALIRNIRLRQSLVYDILEEEETDPVLLSGIISLHDNVQDAAATVIKQIGIDMEKYRNAKDGNEAFKYLRNKIEGVGIFVLLVGDLGSPSTDIEPQTFRGIASGSELAPFIVINDNDAKTAWSFTLLHELIHLLIGESGISNSDVTIQKGEKNIEKFCNDVAAEILLPRIEIDSLRINSRREDLLSLILTIAKRNNLSKRMVAYNLFKYDKITKNIWNEIDVHLKQQRQDSEISIKAKSKKSGGGNYYVTKRHRVGEGLLKLVKRAVNSGMMQPTKAATVLGVSALSVYSCIREST